MKRIVCLFAGSICILMAAVFGFRAWDFKDKALAVEGVVETTQFSCAHAQVRFSDKSGQVHSFWQGGAVCLRSGDKVTVLYVDADPSSARVDSFGSLYFVALIFSLIGLSFFAASSGPSPTTGRQAAGDLPL